MLQDIEYSKLTPQPSTQEAVIDELKIRLGQDYKQVEWNIDYYLRNSRETTFSSWSEAQKDLYVKHWMKFGGRHEVFMKAIDYVGDNAHRYSAISEYCESKICDQLAAESIFKICQNNTPREAHTFVEELIAIGEQARLLPFEQAPNMRSSHLGLAKIKDVYSSELLIFLSKYKIDDYKELEDVGQSLRAIDDVTKTVQFLDAHWSEWKTLEKKTKELFKDWAKNQSSLSDFFAIAKTADRFPAYLDLIDEACRLASQHTKTTIANTAHLKTLLDFILPNLMYTASYENYKNALQKLREALVPINVLIQELKNNPKNITTLPLITANHLSYYVIQKLDLSFTFFLAENQINRSQLSIVNTLLNVFSNDIAKVKDVIKQNLAHLIQETSEQLVQELMHKDLDVGLLLQAVSAFHAKPQSDSNGGDYNHSSHLNQKIKKNKTMYVLNNTLLQFWSDHADRVDLGFICFLATHRVGAASTEPTSSVETVIDLLALVENLLPVFSAGAIEKIIAKNLHLIKKLTAESFKFFTEVRPANADAIAVLLNVLIQLQEDDAMQGARKGQSIEKLRAILKKIPGASAALSQATTENQSSIKNLLDISDDHLKFYEENRNRGVDLSFLLFLLEQNIGVAQQPRAELLGAVARILMVFNPMQVAKDIIRAHSNEISQLTAASLKAFGQIISKEINCGLLLKVILECQKFDQTQNGTVAIDTLMIIFSQLPSNDVVTALGLLAKKGLTSLTELQFNCIKIALPLGKGEGRIRFLEVMYNQDLTDEELQGLADLYPIVNKRAEFIDALAVNKNDCIKKLLNKSFVSFVRALQKKGVVIDLDYMFRLTEKLEYYHLLQDVVEKFDQKTIKTAFDQLNDKPISVLLSIFYNEAIRQPGSAYADVVTDLDQNLLVYRASHPKQFEGKLLEGNRDQAIQCMVKIGRDKNIEPEKKFAKLESMMVHSGYYFGPKASSDKTTAVLSKFFNVKGDHFDKVNKDLQESFGVTLNLEDKGFTFNDSQAQDKLLKWRETGSSSSSQSFLTSSAPSSSSLPPSQDEKGSAPTIANPNQ